MVPPGARKRRRASAIAGMWRSKSGRMPLRSERMTSARAGRVTRLESPSKNSILPAQPLAAATSNWDFSDNTAEHVEFCAAHGLVKKIVHIGIGNEGHQGLFP